MKLVILGNGFDIAQKNKIIRNKDGFDTSYLDFGKYLKDNYFDIYKFLNLISFDDIDKKEYWYQFEERLGNPNFKSLVKDMENDVVGTKKLLDLSENEVLDEYKKIAIDYFAKLKRAFCKWISKKINIFVNA